MASIWRTWSSGYADIHVVFDLDFSDISSIRELQKEALIVKTPVDSALVELVDKSASGGGKVLGVTAYLERNGPPSIWLITERIHDFPGVALHEFGHALGLGHTEKRAGDVMSPEHGEFVLFTENDRHVCRMAHVCP